jgi:hypothetical protein
VDPAGDGLLEKAEPLHEFAVAEVTAEEIFTVTTRLKAAPVQPPDVGVTE